MGCWRNKDAPALLRRPPSRSKAPPGPCPLRGPGLLSTRKWAILMVAQGKAPQGLRARRGCARSALRTALPVEGPTGAFAALPPRHPWWLSRRFDAAIPQNRPFPGAVFLRHPGSWEIPAGAALFYSCIWRRRASLCRRSARGKAPRQMSAPKPRLSREWGNPPMRLVPPKNRFTPPIT